MNEITFEVERGLKRMSVVVAPSETGEAHGPSARATKKRWFDRGAHVIGVVMRSGWVAYPIAKRPLTHEWP